MRKKKRERGGDPLIENKAQKLVGAMQLPAGAFFNTAHFEMNSNREVIVEGCRGILEYDENIVKINAGKMITTFIGRDLAIKCLTPDSLVIEGFIVSVEFVS